MGCCKNVADEILVYGCGKTEAEAEKNHDAYESNTYQMCKQQCIQVNEAKCEFKMKEI